jgi:glycosyltransferase involved in cell wall biosynthesis
LESARNKVLIITYYWPPSAGSGVQRWLKFVKYLPGLGWEPYVYTPQNPSFALQDNSLLKNVPAEAKVIRFPIWEPYDTFRGISKIFGKGEEKDFDVVGEKHRSLFKRTATWIRGNLIIPDPRVFWVRPSVKFLHDFLRDNHINIIITTGPPHSMHLIGYQLKKRNPALRWIADFRDPWSNWGLLDSLSVGSVARRIHRKLERKVLENADEVTTITPFYVRQFEILGKRRVHLLTNGYDEEDFINLKKIHPDKFMIRHVGIVNEKCDPRPFMEVLLKLMNDDAEFGRQVRVEFVGEVISSFKSYVSADERLSEITSFVKTVPHEALPPMYGSSALLLLILFGYKDAEGYMPGKLFEYMASGVPVLGIGPVNGDAAAFLKETNAGVMASETDVAAIADFVMEVFRVWHSGQISDSGGLFTQYSRRGVTQKLGALLLDQVR